MSEWKADIFSTAATFQILMASLYAVINIHSLWPFVVGLTKGEVIGNSILFLFAGFQTTADSMMFIFYELAYHPDIQSKVSQ